MIPCRPSRAWPIAAGLLLASALVPCAAALLKQPQDPEPMYCDTQHSVPTEPVGGDCTDNTPPFRSQCWRQFMGNPEWDHFRLYPELTGQSRGFALNIDLYGGLMAGDFPPRSLDLRQSSSPLIAAEAPSAFEGPAAFATRPVLGQSVDLITGTPMLQEVDLELPFGGAVFRLVRTCGEAVEWRRQPSIYGPGRAGELWDWAGLGWMIGENPIFLFDAAYDDLVNVPPTPGQDAIRRCYFIPDAHRTIPFDLVENGTGKPSYVAPAYLDASLSYEGGVWDPTTHEWTTPPGTFHILLNRGAIRYTIQLVTDANGRGEDVPDSFNADTQTFFSLHNRPERGLSIHQTGAGIPYYGLVKRIEDRYGNYAQIEHCGFAQTAFPTPPVMDCVQCAQNCNEKGQIKAVRLFAAGDTQPTWTLVYVHRNFWNPHRWPHDDQNLVRGGDMRADSAYVEGQNALHAVLVYRHDVDTSGAACYTLPGDLFVRGPAPAYPGIDSFDEIDAFDTPQLVGLPATWRYQIRYTYTERHYALNGLHSDWGNPQIYFAADGAAGYAWGVVGGPYLLKVTVDRRLDDAAGSPSSSDITLYRYSSLPIATSGAYFFRLLTHVYRNDTVRTLVSGFKPPYHTEQFSSPNELLLYNDLDQIMLPKADGSGFEYVRLGEVADETFLRGRHGTEMERDPFIGQMIADFIKRDGRTLLYADTGVRIYGSRQTDGGGGFHKLYQFLRMPVPQEELDAGDFDLPIGPSQHYCYRLKLASADNRFARPGRSLFYHPHYWQAERPGGVPFIDRPPLDDATFITVVDTYDRNPAAYDDGWSAKIVGRRVVQMNCNGYVLKDQSWTFDDAGGAMLTGTLGASEEIVIDAHGRITERRTLGWDTLPNPGQPLQSPRSDHGLIYVYGYDPSITDPSAPGFRDPVMLGMKRGTLDQAKPLREYQRHPDRPDLITLVKEYHGTGSSEYSQTKTEYEFLDNGQPIEDRPVRSRIVYRPQAPLAPGGAALYAVEAEFRDDQGRPVWRGYGTLASDSLTAPPSPEDRFFVDYFRYDAEGRLEYSIVDVDASDAPAAVLAPRGPDLSHPYAIEAAPAGLRRRPAPDPNSDPALTQVTAYEYGAFGLKTVFHPNGSRDIYHYFERFRPDVCEWDPKVVERRVIRGVTNPGAPSVQDWKIIAPGEQTFFHGGRMLEQVTVRWPVTEGSGSTEPPDFDTGDPPVVVARLKPGYDASGRMTGMRFEDAAGNAAVQISATFNDLGQVDRTRAPDGTITRRTYDALGRLVGVYRGTSDIHDFWRTRHPNEPADDNLVQIEKRRYGADETNAGRVVEIRSLREKPTNQYPPAGQSSNVDSLGWTVHYEYDWRMRPVVETRRQRTVGGVDGPPISHHVTWYDHMDRVVFTALYDGTLPNLGAVDPRDMHWGKPTAAQLLATSPLELNETTYNARGQIAEERRYRTAPGSTDHDYLATTTFYDHEGRPVWQREPNGGVTVMTYDALGRLLRTSLYAGDPVSSPEVHRIETLYDANGNAIQTVTTERAHDRPTGPLLDPTPNGVDAGISTYTFDWYDDQNRHIARAELGTNSAADVFATGTLPQRLGMAAPTWDDTSQSYVRPPNLPPSARITLYEYDAAGRLARTRHPNGAVTDRLYDGLGRVVLTTERTTGAAGSIYSQTGYFYNPAGQLEKMAAVLDGHQFNPDGTVNWAATDGTLQVTRFVYGATVVDDSGSFTPISQHNGWIKAVHFPSRNPAEHGQYSGVADLTFEYYPDGLLASRTDRRGARFTHVYDERGLLAQTQVQNPTIVTPVVPVVKDQNSRIIYEHDAKGRLTMVSAETVVDGAVHAIVAQNRFDYDDLDNLLRDWQGHGAAVQTDPNHPTLPLTPSVAYQWTFGRASDGGNINRLDAMVYPKWAHLGRQRTLSFEYGAPGGIDDALSRITGISDNDLGQLAEFGYTGSGRRVERRAGVTSSSVYAVRQPSGPLAPDPLQNPVYDRLDRFGRPKELAFFRSTGGTPAATHTYQYGYDASGNRTYARVTQSPVGGQSRDNVRSFAYRYDPIDRLIGSDMGVLDLTDPATPEIIQPNQAPFPRLTEWNLDRLGNWAGLPNGLGQYSVGRTIWGDRTGDGQLDPLLETTHHVNAFNQITALATATGGGAPVQTAFVHDLAGNLVCDGQYFYQYDAWNRLVQVNEKGTLTFDGSGKPAAGQPGRWVLHYTYDGLGRLIRKQVPWDSSSTQQRWESYYYDGVRRVHDVFRDPITGDGPKGFAEMQQLAGPAATDTVRTVREYVYTPGYVDEFVCQIDGSNSPQYLYQDAGYTVVGVTDAAGQVVQQHSWDPYGEVTATETLAAHAECRIGHQGLFFDRFDLYAGDTTSRTLALDAPGVYQNRNRSYLPKLGRFLQRDPNETGLLLLDVTGYLGVVIEPSLDEMSPIGLYGNGMGLYAYVGSNPVSRADPTGLSFGLIGQLAVTGIDSYLSAESTLDEARQGILLAFGVYEMMRNYAAFQSFDAEWAMDWSAPDDAYTRSAEFAIGTGSWSYNDYEDYSFDEEGEGDELAMAARSGGSRKKCNLRGTSREEYTKKRRAWNNLRSKIWKKEAELNPGAWSPSQLSRMKRGLAPRGWVIHHNKPLMHGGTNNVRNLTIMRASDHRAYFDELHSPSRRGRPSIPGRRNRPGPSRGLPRRIVWTNSDIPLWCTDMMACWDVGLSRFSGDSTDANRSMWDVDPSGHLLVCLDNAYLGGSPGIWSRTVQKGNPLTLMERCPRGSFSITLASIRSSRTC